MSDALELAQVSKVYEVGGAEVVALNHIDLVVAEREVVTLLGPSGSGKTTLLSIAGGLLTPSTGQVVVGGNDITRFSARKLTKFRRRYVGFIFQAVNLVPFLTARENLLVVAELTRRDRRKAIRRADALLDGLGLTHRVDNLPGQLSGGEKQRVAIGRALMNEPTLVLVDEPTSALDSRMGEQVMELIVSEVKARDAAAVVVTHDQRMTRYGDRILTMGDGRIASIQPRPEWTTHRPDPYAEPEPPEPDVYAEPEPAAQPWAAGGGGAGYGAATSPRPVVNPTGTGAGLYGGRAGRAAAGWRGFPQPQRQRTDTGATRATGAAARGASGATARGGPGAGGAPGVGGAGRTGPVPTVGGPDTRVGGPQARSAPPGGTGRAGRAGPPGRAGGDEAMTGLFGPERRGRRWRRPEGGTATGQTPTVRDRGAATPDDRGGWGPFDDPSISPPGGTPRVDGEAWDDHGTAEAWDGGHGAEAWDGAPAGSPWQGDQGTTWEGWGPDDTDPGAEEARLPGADERLDRRRLEEPVPGVESARWRYGSWPPSGAHPAIEHDAEMDTAPIEVTAVESGGRVDPVDVARAAIHRARAQAGEAVGPPPGAPSRPPLPPRRPAAGGRPPAGAPPPARPARPAPSSPPGGNPAVLGPSAWAPAAAGNYGDLPPAPGPDEDDEPPRSRRRRRPGRS